VTLLVVEPVRLTEYPEDRDAVHADPHHELEETLPRGEVEALVFVEGRGEYGNDACIQGEGAAL
jgi:hypothetical protein